MVKVRSGVNDAGRNFTVSTLFPLSFEQLIQMHASQTGEPNRILDGKILGD
jgi:hypothetical protein